VDVELRQSLWVFIQELNRAGHTIVLTTHYLEEAETLCNRIAMLKAGRVIALEDKATLLGQGSARRDIMLRLDPPGLPPALEPLLLRREGSKVWLRLADIDQLGGVLAQVQAAGARVRDFEVVELDLEQVFVARMQGKEA
jgi:ABC-2 type transport system ATP-binding protein